MDLEPKGDCFGEYFGESLCWLLLKVFCGEFDVVKRLQILHKRKIGNHQLCISLYVVYVTYFCL